MEILFVILRMLIVLAMEQNKKEGKISNCLIFEETLYWVIPVNNEHGFRLITNSCKRNIAV